MGFRYIGAKTKIIENVLKKIDSIVDKGAHVVDLMSGTGTVSRALRECGYRVTSNDIMTYSYHHARTVLHFTAPPLFEKANEFIDEYYSSSDVSLFPSTPYDKIIACLNNVPLVQGYFWKEFSVEGCPENSDRPRNYFSPLNAKKIDSIRFWILELYRRNLIDDLEYSLLVHDLIMAANDVANIAGTYGHYMSKLTGRAKDLIKLKPEQLLLIDDGGKHTVLQGRAEDVSGGISADLCYIDPPYMKRQYAANYHLLETIARGDEPEAVGVSGLRPWRDQYSNFCTKTRIRDSFRKIFTDMKCPHFLVSYSEDGLLEIGDIKKLFSEFGEVKIYHFSHKRFKSNDSKLPLKIKEYIIHLKIA